MSKCLASTLLTSFLKTTPTTQIIMLHTSSEMLLYLTLLEIKTTPKRYIFVGITGWMLGNRSVILTCTQNWKSAKTRTV
jgi:hypothetical protein